MRTGEKLEGQGGRYWWVRIRGMEVRRTDRKWYRQEEEEKSSKEQVGEGEEREGRA